MSEIFQRILAAVSGTESSLAAAEMALRLARVHGAQLAVVTVVDTAFGQEMARLLRQTEQEVLAKLEASGRGYLRHCEVMGRREGISVETVVRRGVPYLEIAAEAEARQADLVVLGSTHVAGPRRLAIGRVVERVIEHVECPVLVVRHSPQQQASQPA